jgi:hypothetical protein
MPQKSALGRGGNQDRGQHVESRSLMIRTTWLDDVCHICPLPSSISLGFPAGVAERGRCHLAL